MKIIAVGFQNSAVAYHRLFLPLAFMTENGSVFFTDTLNDDLLKEGYQILLINRYIQGLELDQILAFKKQYDFKLVVDIDDFWHLDYWHILSSKYPTQKIIDHIKAADMVTCTNKELRDEILPINNQVHVLPNALPFGQDQFTDLRQPSTDERVRFVYTGSMTHQKDVELLKNPMKRVAGDGHLTKQIHFCICGYDPDNTTTHSVWHKMINDFLYGFKVPGYVRAALPVTQYMNFYNEADVSIVPLVQSRFNGMKSNLKVLEAACKKIPVVASFVKPYCECPYVHPIESQSDWYKAIKKMTVDAIYRQERGIANHEWCVENHSLAKINETRKQLLHSLI